MTASVIDRSQRTTLLGADLNSVSTMEEALVRADLAWGLTVVSGDEHFSRITDEGVETTSFPGMRLIQRDDTGVTLGVVGQRYRPVDNRSVFSLGDYILAQGGKLVSGGALDHGREAFMRFDLPGSAVTLADGKDLIRFGVVVKANHSGSGTVTAALEGTRLVCTNGMVAAMGGVPYSFSVRHTASAETRMEEARDIIKGAGRYATEFAAVAEHMLDTPMTVASFTRYIDRLFPAPSADAGRRAETVWQNRRAQLLSLFRFADTNKVGRGTRYGAYNAVTEYADWVAPVRSNGAEAVGVRVRRQFNAAAQPLKDAAFALAAV